MPPLRQRNKQQASAAAPSASAASSQAGGENKPSRKQLLQQWKQSKEKSLKENVVVPAAPQPAPQAREAAAARKPASAAANKIRAQRALKARVNANPANARRRTATDEQKVKEAGLKKIAPGTPVAALKRKIQDARTPREPEVSASAEKQKTKRHKVSPTDEDAPAIDAKSPQTARSLTVSASSKAVGAIAAALPESPGVTRMMLEAKRLYQVCSVDIARIFMDDCSTRPEVINSIAFWMFWAEQEASASSPDVRYVRSVLAKATANVDSMFFGAIEATRVKIEQQLAGSLLEQELQHLESPTDNCDGLDALRDLQNDSFKSDVDSSTDPTKRLNFGADDDHDASAEPILDESLEAPQSEAECSYRRLEEEIAQLTEATLAATSSATKSEASFTRPRSSHKEAPTFDDVFDGVDVASLRANFEHSAKSDKSKMASAEKGPIGGVKLVGMNDSQNVSFSSYGDRSFQAGDASENPLSSYLGSDDESDEELSVSVETRSPKSGRKNTSSAPRVVFQPEHNTSDDFIESSLADASADMSITAEKAASAKKARGRKGVRFGDDVDSGNPSSTKKSVRARKGTPHHSRVRNTGDDAASEESSLLAAAGSAAKTSASTPKARKRTREVTFNDVPEEVVADSFGTYYEEQEPETANVATPARRSRRISGRIQTPAAPKAVV